MVRFLTDTSCVVAALCTWHEHHTRARREIERRLDDDEILVIAAPGLIEAYAVLTRLPPPNRLSPRDCRALLAANFMGDAVEIIALEADGYDRLLWSAPERGIAGGAIYDAVILACGLTAQADVVLTFNERQFTTLAADGIGIVVPP